MLDVVIRGGEVVDGTGGPRHRADVGIRSGRVVGVGAVDEDATRTIDADGLVVAPGFIDIHTHYDAQVLWDPATTPSPFHGVTSIVGGNCGFTIAPVEPSEVEYLTRMLARVEGMPLEALLAGVPYDWRSFGEYLDRLDGTLAVNAGFLVGHSAIRRVVMGDDAVGHEARPEQVDAMSRLLGESIAAGGLGFSSSQATTHNDGDGDPVPSRAATPDELVALAREAGRHEGTTLEFIPAVGGFKEQHLELMARMSEAADRPLNWNVLVPNAARAELAWQALQASDYAAERGGRVIALTVPDVMRTHLTFKAGFVLDALPGWNKTMALPPAEKMRALADPAERARLAERASSDEAGMLRGLARWENMTIVETFAPANEGLVGRRVGDIAAERGQVPFDALLDVVLADELRTVLLPPLAGNDDASWELRRDIWRDERAVVGASDAGAHLDMLSTFSYSTAMLRACRERGLMPLEEAVHLLTDRQARLYGIKGRGRVAEGGCADLVLFDEDRVAPAPVVWRNDLPAGAGRLYAGAEGIDRVLVNGVEIVRSGELTGERPGTLLRSGRDTETVTAQPR
ncbi:MAG TPA: amidohydrolase family protein [Acidimicrobiia bacterium]|nr:amidohydrolase family protein [Acidimicrobiia bacterium]